MRPINDTFLKALLREKCDYTPVWLMRQAGRYLAEYNETRSRAGSFMKLAQSPDLACEVTLQPIDRFHLDAAILFSDILTVPDAMGLGLSFVAGEGPKFERPVRTEADVEALRVPDVEKKLKYENIHDFFTEKTCLPSRKAYFTESPYPRQMESTIARPRPVEPSEADWE